MTDKQFIAATRHWVESLVVAHNLCPFAGRELIENRVRFSVCHANSEEQLLEELQAEMQLLESDAQIETTLLIHPEVLQDFSEYNQFLAYAENLLVAMGWEGIYQIASFHPDYQFAGTGPDHVENYTNRAPYPMLHLLREESLERAIANYPEIGEIPQRNIECMKSLGSNILQQLLLNCFSQPGDDSPQSGSQPRRSKE